MKPYSQDLRQRFFDYALIHSIRETARHYHVSPNTGFLLRGRLFRNRHAPTEDAGTSLHSAHHLVMRHC
jgi:hypothetical protein